MKAALIESFGNLDKVRIKEADEPIPDDDELLISLAYAGVNPVDGKIVKGLLKERMPFQFPIILGWDGAGQVIRVGKNVHDFKPGDQVHAYFRRSEVRWGTFCEQATCLAQNVSLIPKKLRLQEAAVIPTLRLNRVAVPL